MDIKRTNDNKYVLILKDDTERRMLDNVIYYAMVNDSRRKKSLFGNFAVKLHNALVGFIDL